MNTSPIISIRNVNHSFGAGDLRRQVLFDISVDIHAGEIVILTGPSGSGKTTLLTLIGTLRTVQDGGLQVFGRELRNASKSSLLDLRRSIGFIFQSHNLLDSLTALQNVSSALSSSSLSSAQARARSLEMLAAVGLEGFAHAYPRELSGGQKQRVAIARALVNQPAIILADEPTAALDRKSGREIVDLLHKLSRDQGSAILLVTHDNRILDIADRILSLEDGRICSFAQGVAAQAESLITSLTRLNRRGELSRYITGLNDRQFIEVLERTSAEFDQLQRIIHLGQRHALESMVDQLLEALTCRIVQMLEADRATLFLVDRKRGLLRSKIAQHDGSEPLLIEIPIHAGIAGAVATTGEGLNVPDAYAHPMFERAVDARTAYRTQSVLCMPLLNRRREVVAVAQILNKKGGPFTKTDESKFSEFAKGIASIVESCCVEPALN